MSAVQVHVTGAAIQRLVTDRDGPVGRTLAIRGQLVQDAAKAQIEARTHNSGLLKKSVVKRWATHGDDLAILVGVWTVPYALWVHDGNGPPGGRIFPTKSRVLRFQLRSGNAYASTKTWTYRRSVKTSRPNRYLSDNLRRALLA